MPLGTNLKSLVKILKVYYSVSVACPLLAICVMTIGELAAKLFLNGL